MQKFWLIVETLPVNSKFLVNSLFVIFKLRIDSTQHLCYDLTSLSDVLMVRKNYGMFLPHMAGRQENKQKQCC